MSVSVPCQLRRESGHHADLPALQNAADHQHGKQVEEAERDVLVSAPIGDRFMGIAAALGEVASHVFGVCLVND